MNMRPPARDHLAPQSSRFMAVDHRGRVTALIAEGPDDQDQLSEADAAILADLSAEDLELVKEWAAAIEPPEPEADPFAHADHTGTHTHVHSAMGSQGSDETHEHAHSHSGDSSHDHNHSATVTPITAGMDLAAKIAHLRERQAASAPEVERMAVVASTPAGDVDVELAVRWDENAIDPLLWDPITCSYGTKRGAFVSTLPVNEPFAMVAAGADIPQIVDNPGDGWHAILCVEGLRTDEDPGREIMPGACQFPDLPVSLRLQIHDEGGHYGAVTCGRIDSMERQELQGYNAIYSEGVYGTDEHGQMGQLLVEEQTQRFISIDPRNATMEIVEIEISTSNYYDEDCEPDLYEWWVRYTELTIGAATIVATPALQQAVIAPLGVELPETPIAIAMAPPSVIVAAAGDLPSEADFADPGFHVGDPRLIRQADGHFACPLTVDRDTRRVFGHLAYWGADHTGFPGKHRKPPHSPTYAYFMTGARATAEGTKVPIGNLTMGCGHASVAIRDADKAKSHYATPPAHYDGGYGAIQMADVAAGEDDFGIWVAGVLCEDVTEADIRKFESLGLSGDWRERAGRLHLVAALAVPVPGFPIAREDALVASAEIIDLSAVRAGLDETGEVYSLVAAGRVRRISAEEQLAGLQAKVDLLLADLDARKASTLRGQLEDLIA